jgi:hypothetical protein
MLVCMRVILVSDFLGDKSLTSSYRNELEMHGSRLFFISCHLVSLISILAWGGHIRT